MSLVSRVAADVQPTLQRPAVPAGCWSGRSARCRIPVTRPWSRSTGSSLYYSFVRAFGPSWPGVGPSETCRLAVVPAPRTRLTLVTTAVHRKPCAAKDFWMRRGVVRQCGTFVSTPPVASVLVVCGHRNTPQGGPSDTRSQPRGWRPLGDYQLVSVSEVSPRPSIPGVCGTTDWPAYPCRSPVIIAGRVGLRAWSPGLAGLIHLISLQ